jgi:DNA-binding Lrp family transcriptional regulator
MSRRLDSALYDNGYKKREVNIHKLRAYVFLVTKPGTSDEVLRYLSKVAQVKGVTQVDSVYGRFDAIVTVEAPNLEKLGDLVYRVIEKVPNVIHTETALALSRTKE